MLPFTDTSLGFTMVNGVGQMALVAVFFGMLKRFEVSPRLQSLALGLLFGTGAILAMLTPAAIAPGVLIDTRAIHIGLAAAFAGPLAAAVAASMAAAYRIASGGVGMPLGLVSIVIAFGAGLVWTWLCPREQRGTPLGLAMLGGAIAAHSLVMPFLPVALPEGFFLLYYPSIVVTCLVATMTLGWMMQREIKLILRERSLTDFAFTDPLTGLANRRAFDRRIAQRDFQMDAPPFGLVFLDIDHFKSVNDRFGHDAGDVVLTRIAATLSDCIRDEDLVARYGGEEFVILLPDTDLDGARIIAERIRERVASQDLHILDQHLAITASCGVASSLRHVDHRTIVSAADLALYRAKAAGRNRVETAPVPGERLARQAAATLGRQSGRPGAAADSAPAPAAAPAPAPAPAR